MGQDAVAATASANEASLQTQLKTEKAAMVTRHNAAEVLAKASSENAIVKFGKSAGRKTEYALFVLKETMLNLPGCASGRKGCVAIRVKAKAGVEGAKAQTKKMTGK
eukprot:CAMPEP_0119065240 /NCGR_PEP_ID=MMETSP1178-20130426/8106_1 /TAXON_ID=33656 /ORGANISM="unid sp, Strain CCMP2000" /LENGTH=106 /DNA_ID=CAMNT_0007046741 /DNA_START=29 /DNA_END=349 /DNA_ORIENTATION=-